MNEIALTIGLAGLAAVAYRWRATIRIWSWEERLGGCVVATAAISLVLLAVHGVLGMVGMDWNAARLAPTFALVRGYRLYYPAESGPILDHVYGPVSALAFLPATIFRTPTPAVLAGGILQVSFVFGAMLVFVWHTRGATGADRLRALACGFGACLLMARYPGTSYWISMVHADGPSLALGLLACTALVFGREGAPTRRALLGSAAAAVLSCWAKQTAAPLALALVLAVWLAHGRATALRYGLMLAGIGVTLSVIFLIWFGQAMLFNMVFLVSRQPWMKPGLGGLLATVGSLLWSIREIVAMLAVALTIAFFSRRLGPPLVARPWFPPLLAAVFLIPTGALGANKIGGEPSSFHATYYLIASVAALLADTAQYARAGRGLVWAFCGFGILTAWQVGWSTRYARPEFWHNDNQLAYEFALHHPGEAYFPWQPLASLLADGRLYHFEYGMIDRFLGGSEPTPTHVLADVPPRLRCVAGSANLWTFRYFTDFSEEKQLPELPGWVVRCRPLAGEDAGAE